MTATEVAALLSGSRQTKNGWQACCPAHEDHNASLSIADCKDGRVLLNCHAGCDFHKITAAMGLKKGDLAPAPAPANALEDSDKLGKIVAEYSYTDEKGNLLFQVVRFSPKNFRQRRPDPEKPGKWIWNLNGQARVLYRLPTVLKAIAEDKTVFLVEGEKDADALADLDLCATCNPGGAGKWSNQYTERLTGAKVVILPDKDDPGRLHAKTVAQELHGKAKSIHIIELPDRNGKQIKDAADWKASGGTIEELKELRKATHPWEPQTDKPEVILPGSAQTISDAGRALGKLLASTGRYFRRGNIVTTVSYNANNQPILEPVKNAKLVSVFESVAALRRHTGKYNTDHKPQLLPATCQEQKAKEIAASDPFQEELPPINQITSCPVLIEKNGELIEIVGYDRESGILAGGEKTRHMELPEARKLLKEAIQDFCFTSNADHARALAAMITPALVFGGLLNARAPLDLSEADKSQAGKGYRNKITAAIYGQKIRTVTQKTGGVGSPEESFNTALLQGANFIAWDNIRGKVDTQSLESFLTEDTYQARMPYHEPITIDPSRFVIMLTSNKADMTQDLANRCSCVCIKKQPPGYKFKEYHKSDILDHIRANQSRYLGAVFAVVRAWYTTGKKRTEEPRHDFRTWARVMDWITQNLLEAGPLLDGHRETQDRMAHPSLNWLRDVALAIPPDRQGEWLRTNHIVRILEDTEIEIPGLKDGNLNDQETHKNVLQATGRKLATCFKDKTTSTLTIDNITIERKEAYDVNLCKECKEYCFTVSPIDSPGKNESIGGETPQQAHNLNVREQEKPNSSYEPPMDTPMDPPIKPLIPPNPPNTFLTFYSPNMEQDNKGGDINIKEPIGGIGGIGDLGKKGWGHTPPNTLPLTEAQPDLSAEETAMLTRWITRQGPEIRRWVTDRTSQYAKQCPDWPPATYRTRAQLDLGCWQLDRTESKLIATLEISA